MESFSDKLIKWHKKSGRKNLPWQIDKSPYKIWISEIMLQQTQVATVIPYFHKFIKKFPSISELANSNEDEVLAAWSGLGYYARARNLYKTAKIIQTDYDSLLPESLINLMNLPGIGRSTAGAILSLGMNKKAPILDANVKRVIARYANIKSNITTTNTLNNLWGISEELLPEKDFSVYNQSLMDLGATICKVTKPLCKNCPVSNECKAKKNNSIHLVPYKNKKLKKPIKKIFWLLPYTDSGYFYLKKRPSKGLWGGLWTFLEDQSLEDLIKENSEKLDLQEDSLKELSLINHSFSHYNLKADIYLIKSSGSISYNEWKKIEELDNVGMPKPVIETLKKIKNNGKASFL